MNRRSPRVVRSGKKPLRSTVGERISHTVMPISMSTMQLKNTATGKVQAIHSNMPISSDSTHRETLRDVVTNKPDHDGTRHDGQHTGRRQGGPVHARGRHRARHGG